jgi:hypothetical protein
MEHAALNHRSQVTRTALQSLEASREQLRAQPTCETCRSGRAVIAIGSSGSSTGYRSICQSCNDKRVERRSAPNRATSSSPLAAAKPSAARGGAISAECAEFLTTTPDHRGARGAPASAEALAFLRRGY